MSSDQIVTYIYRNTTPDENRSNTRILTTFLFHLMVMGQACFSDLFSHCFRYDDTPFFTLGFSRLAQDGRTGDAVNWRENSIL